MHLTTTTKNWDKILPRENSVNKTLARTDTSEVSHFISAFYRILFTSQLHNHFLTSPGTQSYHTRIRFQASVLYMYFEYSITFSLPPNANETQRQCRMLYLHNLMSVADGGEFVANQELGRNRAVCQTTLRYSGVHSSTHRHHSWSVWDVTLTMVIISRDLHMAEIPTGFYSNGAKAVRECGRGKGMAGRGVEGKGLLHGFACTILTTIQSTWSDWNELKLPAERICRQTQAPFTFSSTSCVLPGGHRVHHIHQIVHIHGR